LKEIVISIRDSDWPQKYSSFRAMIKLFKMKVKKTVGLHTWNILRNIGVRE
jgi:hypothetical protein